MKSISARVRECQGFSLVEMMVALVAGLIVSAAVIAFLLSSMKSNGEYVQSTRLTQELRNTLDLVSRDLVRAGYSDGALTYKSLPYTSPLAPVFIKDLTPFVIAGTASTYPNADTDGCVLYAYDRTFPIGYAASCHSVNGCGTSSALDLNNAELRGIRRTCVDGACDGEADDVGVIEFAESSATVTPTCTGGTAVYGSNPPACNTASGWCSLSDPTLLNITRFMVINSSADVSNVMRVRNLRVYLEGQLRNGADFSRAVSTNVKIRADCINPTIARCSASP